MAQAGMSFRQVLASLTTAPAEKFGDARHAGRVAPGYDADLTVVKGDPAADIDALAAVEYTLRDGRIIYRRRPADSRTASLSPATVPSSLSSLFP
jgi:imidazolonepropionase-like amidohydrolase